jgi:hypothetical protein
LVRIFIFGFTPWRPTAASWALPRGSGRPMTAPSEMIALITGIIDPSLATRNPTGFATT